MNEELKIIIKAVTDEAKKSIADVKKELEKVKQEGKDTGATVDKALKGFAKGAAVAVTAITALTAAMAKLGHSAQDINKGFSKLKTSFENAGSSAKQATKYYKELFGVLGDHDRTIETGQSLARVTTDPAALNDYKNIMAGAVSQYGEGYNSEALAENISETIAAAKVTGDLERVLVEAGVSVDGFNLALQQATNTEQRELLVRNTLNGVLGNAGKAYIAANQATIAYNQSQANLNVTLASAAAYTTPLLTSLNNLSATLLTAMAPALETVALYLTAFIQLLAEAIQWVGGFFSLFSSSSSQATADVAGYQAAMQNYLNSLRGTFGGVNTELDDNLDKINAVKKATMGFDELNVVSKPVSVSTGAIGGGSVGGGSSIGSLPVAPNPADYGIGVGLDLSSFDADLAETKEKIQGVLTLVGAVAITLGAWKLTGFISDVVKAYKAWHTPINKLGKDWEKTIENAQLLHQRIRTIGGSLIAIAGTMLLVKGYSDAWANGVDWGNMALMITGVAIACAGLYVAFGKLTMSLGIVASGVALVIMGIKDFINNGPTLQNTILIIGGAIAIAVGMATAGVSILISVLTGVVVAIGAFIAAILLEEPAIMSVKDAQEQLNAAKEKAAEAENNYINSIDNAEAALKRLEEAEKKTGLSGAELYKQVQEGTLDYKDMTAEQREVYKAYLDNEKKQKDLEKSTKAYNEAKKAETMASFEHQMALAKESGSYDEFKKSVVEAFEAGEISAEEARMLIEKSMSEMSNSSQKTFMEDLPNDIKEGMNPHRYESTKTKLKKWFGQAWKDIKSVFNDFKEWAGNIGSKIGDAIWAGLKAAINGILKLIEDTINAPIRLINKAIKVINEIPGVNISKMKEIKVPRLATGGIVTSSTLANIGENGREAVLPLENHTEWMDKLAEKISARQSTPSKLVLVVDGKELGYATINSINDITRQTGTLQLNVI